MGHKKPHVDEKSGWFSRKEMASVLGYSLNGIDVLRQRLPVGIERKTGRSVELHGPKLIRHLLRKNAKRAEKRARNKVRINGHDTLLVSPGLERQRIAKAQLAELQLLERRGTLVSREKNREGLLHLGLILREFGEWLRRNHPDGDSVGRLNEFLDRWERELEERFPPVEHEQEPNGVNQS